MLGTVKEESLVVKKYKPEEVRSRKGASTIINDKLTSFVNVYSIY